MKARRHNSAQSLDKIIERDNRRVRLRIIGRSLIVLSVLSCSLIVGASLWLYGLGIFDDQSSRLETIQQWKPQDNSIIYDRNGEKIGEIFNDFHLYTPLSGIPKEFTNALLAIEDRNFWLHSGVDYVAIGRAVIAYFRTRGEYSQGASTITQQVVRHLLLTKEKSLERKVKEIALAVQLSKVMTKEALLEIYCNSMFLGNGAYGIGAATWRYFGKSLDQLALHESALIAGLFQSPSRLNPIRNPQGAKHRQKQVLNAMVSAGYITADEARAAYRMPLEYKQYQPLHGKMAPFFIDHIKQEAEKILTSTASLENQGLRIYTTLDPVLQLFAEEAIKSAEPTFNEASKQTESIQQDQDKRSIRRVEGALLVTSSTSGEILAMVGGRDYRQSQFNRTTNAKRSPGSAFKPIVFALSLENGRKWSDMIYVAPITVNGEYRPRNSTSDYLTETTLLRAFYRSMNAPAVAIGQELGIEKIMNYAKKLGLYSPIKNETGSILGSSDATMLDLARVYSTFANSGNKVEQIAITSITDRNGQEIYRAPDLAERQANSISPQIAYLITEGMRNVLIHGTGQAASSISHFAVGKTGTSNQSKDSWFCGYTTDLTAIVWSGTDDFTPVDGEFHGSTLSLPIWKSFMSKAIHHRAPEKFIPPPGVIAKSIDPSFGHESAKGIQMWFTENNLPSNEPSALESLRMQGNYRNAFSQ